MSNRPAEMTALCGEVLSGGALERTARLPALWLGHWRIELEHLTLRPNPRRTALQPTTRLGAERTEHCRLSALSCCAARLSVQSRCLRCEAAECVNRRSAVLRCMARLSARTATRCLFIRGLAQWVGGVCGVIPLYSKRRASPSVTRRCWRGLPDRVILSDSL